MIMVTLLFLTISLDFLLITARQTTSKSSASERFASCRTRWSGLQPSPTDSVLIRFLWMMGSVLIEWKKIILRFLFFELWPIVFTLIYLNFQVCRRPKKNVLKVTKFTGKLSNEQKRMKNQFYYFLRFLVFEIWSILYWNSEKNAS